VELKVLDTRSDKVEAANAVFRLVEKDHVTAIIGDAVLGTTCAGSFHAERRGISLVTPGAGSPKVICGCGYALRAGPIDEDQAVEAANLALNCLDARTAAIICDMSDEHSIGLAAGFGKVFTRAGGRILLQSRIKTGDRDFMAQINQVKTTKPDILYAPLCCMECALIARQARNMGVDVTMIAGDAVHVQELIEFGGRSVENLIFTTYFHESMIHTDLGKRFRDLCATQTGRQPRAAQAMGADAYMLILDAITRAGSSEPIRIREALSSLSCFDGVTGKISIEKGVKATRPVVITKVKDGRFVKIESRLQIEQGR
jgi:branched-chain amino acid transport system substrate-binding protein